jgi:hypothetical protein
MSTPTGDDSAFLYELEGEVREELTVIENSRLEEEPHCDQYDDSLPNPDAQRYETGLQNLLGAVEALEDSDRRGSIP